MDGCRNATGDAVNPGVLQVEGDLPDRVADAFRGGAVAVDIETSGLDWRVDRIGTVQVYSPTVGTVIVKTGHRPPAVLVALLADPATQKVFHHAPFDLAFLAHGWSVTAAAVSCTKIASKVLSPQADRADHSLQALLRARLGVALEKGQVRVSDWTAGALTEQQVEYAASDVRHLLDLHEDLLAALAATDRLGLYESCCRFLPAETALTVGGYPDVFRY